MLKFAEIRGSLPSLRHVVGLSLDGIATLCGLCGALLLFPPRGLEPNVRTAAVLLMVIRLVTVMAARLHRQSSGSCWHLDTARLALSMFAGSVLFALACRGFPRSAYIAEFVLSTSIMTLLRAPPVAEGLDRLAHLPGVALGYSTAEGPRRALNVLVALAGLVLTFPLWILIAIAIKLTSRGPVFYKQERVGLDRRGTCPLSRDPRRRRDIGGRPFMIYKFRTMTVDAESSTGAVWAAKGDPRVTRVGKFLRHFRLDELPQFVNVLKGDMNIVGPRPERPTIFAELRTKIPGYHVRQRARPGITGYAQVNLEYDSSIDDVTRKLAYDLEYVSHPSVAADLYIMAKTLPVMLFREKVLGSATRRTLEPVSEAAPGAGEHESVAARALPRQRVGNATPPEPPGPGALTKTAHI